MKAWVLAANAPISTTTGSETTVQAVAQVSASMQGRGVEETGERHGAHAQGGPSRMLALQAQAAGAYEHRPSEGPGQEEHRLQQGQLGQIAPVPCRFAPQLHDLEEEVHLGQPQAGRR